MRKFVHRFLCPPTSLQYEVKDLHEVIVPQIILHTFLSSYYFYLVKMFKLIRITILFAPGICMPFEVHFVHHNL